MMPNGVSRRDVLAGTSIAGLTALLGSGASVAFADEPEAQEAEVEAGADELGPANDDCPLQITPAHQGLLDAGVTGDNCIDLYCRDGGLTQITIEEVGWKTWSRRGYVDETGNLLYYSDNDFNASKSDDGDSLIVTFNGVGQFVVSGDEVLSFEPAEDSDDSAVQLLNFLEDSSFSDVVYSKQLSDKYVLLRRQQAGFTSYDYYEIVDSEGETVARLDPGEWGEDFQPDSVIGWGDAAVIFWSMNIEDAGDTPKHRMWAFDIHEQVWYERTMTTDGAWSRYGDSYLLASLKDDEAIFLKKDGETVTLSADGLSSDLVVPWRETGGWVFLTSSDYDCLVLYEFATDTYRALSDQGYLNRINWDLRPEVLDDGTVCLWMTGDDGLSYVGVFDDDWEIRFDPVKADSPWLLFDTNRLVVKRSLGDELREWIFYDFDGAIDATFTSEDGMYLGYWLSGFFTDGRIGALKTDESDGSSIPCVVDSDGNIVFEGIDVSNAKRLVLDKGAY
jgi:hypothetical protein